MNEDELIEKLQTALTEYKLTKSKDAKSELNMFSNLLSVRLSTEGEEVFDVIKKVEDSSKILDSFNKPN